MDIGFISLGCSKNRVDTEIMMSILKKKGHKIVDTIEPADLVIINTCGFIEDAKVEAIDAILEMGDLKRKGIINYIIATGCLSQRYKRELIEEMPELDAVVGIGDFLNIDEVVEQVANGDKVVLVNNPPEKFIEKGSRILTTPKGSAYLKITEGCNNRCTYCTIPTIRGKLRSYPIEEVIREAHKLVAQGAKELVLIGQDTARYGQDLEDNSDLSLLIKRLAQISDLAWIRLMYVHPAHLTEKTIEVLAREKKVVPYIDLPIQHTADKILKTMNRRHNFQELFNLINYLRNTIENLVLRTTAMVGFPGETESDFNHLYDFIRETEFDWLGAFKYTAEAGTPSSSLPNHISEKVKQERLEKILALQSKITRRKNILRLDSKQKILVSSQVSPNLYLGRGYFQAPEVDGITMVKTKELLMKGEFVDVVLKAVRNYDMIGELYHESP